MDEYRAPRFYRTLAAAQVRSQAQYRASFAVELASLGFFAALDVVEVLVLFRVTDAMAGFTLTEVLLMSALATLGFSLADLVCGNVERLKHYVRTGLLDAMLIRPRRILPQLLAIDFQFRRVARCVFALAVLIVAVSVADIDWNGWRAALVVITPLTAAVFFSALFVTTATVAFWWIESGEFGNSFTYGGREFTNFPVNVYGGALRHVFGFALGFAFVSYYPALAVLGRDDPMGMPMWFAAGGFGAAVAASLVAGLAWRTGIRHYKGTGS